MERKAFFEFCIDCTSFPRGIFLLHIPSRCKARQLHIKQFQHRKYIQCILWFLSYSPVSCFSPEDI
ncbi:hypothetical protein I7I50_10249 [Histoplasma capsulatum G186AR]|uniref:Uncharacterized protein n=1 Tax=Ajellomyces capsulatus TaxID=5037 RepID=A0A8H7Z3J5_AJECA|nr:hypothetical protein I7I52_01488 [Histoplasma capsulatum]QSS69071.1 hypothetical protein I7I50_10249 [Histoplasma capsulatum G186AR]